MKHQIGYIGLLFSIVLIIAGLFAQSYSTQEYIGIRPFGYWRIKYPYRDYGFPLILIGILFFIVGIGSFAFKPEETKVNA